MARSVREIMNKELLSVRPASSAADALGYINAFEVTSVPVIGEEGAPIGVVSVRDLTGDLSGKLVTDLMSRPAVSVRDTASIQEAAQILCSTGLHRLPVVDVDENAVGMVSAIDIIRGLLGLPATHPPSFPHLDAQTGLIWTDDCEFSLDHVQSVAPDGPGVFALIRGGVGLAELIVWAEACANVRARLLDLMSTPQPYPVSNLQDTGRLRFRCAMVSDPERRRRAMSVIRDQAWVPPR